MLRPLLAIPLCLIVVAGCGETRHPVRQEKMAPATPEPEGSQETDRVAPPATDGEKPSLPPGHPPMSAMHGPVPTMPPARGELNVAAPEGWVNVQPTGMIRPDAEFALPKVEGDEDNGRLTVMMMAGGTVEKNVVRWQGQFDDRKKETVEEIDISGTKVTLVDLSGTFKEGGMMGRPVTKHPGYRMLGAIIVMPDGLLFVKGCGPENTMAKYADQFRNFVESLASPGDEE